MGVVFRARDEQTSRSVVVKVIEGRDATDIERSRREATTLARLAHPGIVQYVADGVTDGGALFLAMQWVDGVTVAERLRTTGFTLREAAIVVRSVAAALGAAHDAGILHRDVKPTNVILPAGDHAAAMLIDFGIARDNAADRSLTRTGIAIGTPGYMAPEQARGDRMLTPAVDVFGLGCLFYECATGRPAFSGTLRAAILTKILFAEPDSFDATCPEAPIRLREAIDRMLHKDPSRRLASGHDVAAALDDIGAIPDGPRRTNRAMIDTPTARPSVAEARVNCLVLAARGDPDDPLDPPSETERAELAAALASLNVTPIVLETGAVVACVVGAPADVAQRAARCALAIRRVLSGWMIVMSPLEQELAVVADTGTQLLATSAIAMIFRKLAAGTIVIDPSLVPWLEADFELDRTRPPKLIATRPAPGSRG
jgi:hypothetical protein